MCCHFSTKLCMRIIHIQQDSMLRHDDPPVDCGGCQCQCKACLEKEGLQGYTMLKPWQNMIAKATSPHPDRRSSSDPACVTAVIRQQDVADSQRPTGVRDTPAAARRRTELDSLRAQKGQSGDISAIGRMPTHHEDHTSGIWRHQNVFEAPSSRSMS